MPRLTPAETKQLFADLEIKSLSEINETWVGIFLGKVSTDPVKERAWKQMLDIVKDVQPAAYAQLIAYAKSNKGMLLEFQGAEPWHKRMGALTFTRPFAPIQQRFLDWNWRALMKVRKGVDLLPTELVGFQPWPRETGKCLAKGTEILREDGTRIPIEQVVEGERLLSVDVATGRSVVDTVKDVWSTGTKRCLRIKTRTGKYLELTPEHRLWAFDGWKTAGQIKVGDRVALPRRTRTQSTGLRSDEEVRLLAYMIAEGCTTKVTRRYACITSHSGFTNADSIIVKDFEYCANAMGFTVKKRDKRYGYFLGKAQDWIREVGIDHKGAHEKRVPDWVFRLPERQRWMFLAAMIDTDGWTTKSEGLAIGLSNEALIIDLTYLFLSVGVVSTVRRKPTRCRDSWTLAVDKEYLSRCATYMPLILKNRRLDDAVTYSRHSLLDAYPRSVVRGLAPGVNRKIRNVGGPQLSSSCALFTRPKARQVLALCLIPQLAWLEQAEVFWDEVMSIEPCGVREVYDLEMSSASHNFIANGIVSHNSSITEWACIAEGAILRNGYVIYLSGKQAQAEDHVVAIRDRIEKEHVAELYPWLSKPKMGAHSNKFGWGREFLMTHGGWAIRPIGADVAIRGGKRLDLRVTLIVVDDYDELGDSPVVVAHKENMLTRSILPMGNNKTRVLVPQNPIHENSVVNRMLTGASLALAIRTVFGEINEDGSLSERPIPAVKDFAYEVRQEDKGPYTVITKGESNWPGITVENWQTTMNRVGPTAFEAEYQHNMSVAKEERVLPEYDDRVLRLHVITWSQYEAKYGHRRIPSDWPCDVGLDIGFTTGHKSAWTFLAKAPDAVSLAGSIFRYRGRTFTGVGIDEQAVIIRSEMWSDERVGRQFMSHEKLGERNVLAQKHNWGFHPCDSAKTAGIAQWRHFLQTDRSQPHPFHRDEKGIDGKWKLGRPAWFDIVDDKQFIASVDDAGLKRHRDGAFNWRNVPVKLTDKGFTIEQPAKMDDDECFVAGTKITTRCGENAIENLRPNDVVLTRQGWRKVLVAKLTSQEAEIWELKLSNGNRLRGTKAHPIWVAGCGWKPLSELKAGERLLSSMECDFTATQTRNIGRTEPTSSPMFTRFKKALAHYTLNFGRQSTGTFQRVMRFITKTITHSIMLTPISSCSLALNTAATTGTICHLNSRRECGLTFSSSKKQQRFGIAVPRGVSGIGSMLRSLSVSLQRFLRSANIVVVNTLHDGGWESIAQPDASKQPNCERRSWRHLHDVVFNAQKSLIHWPTPVERSALTVIQSVQLKQREPVYNLSVDGVPEYFANGVLVHNCDSTRMLTVGFGPMEQTMTPAQKLQSLIPAGYTVADLAKRTDLDPNTRHLTSHMAEFLARKEMKQRLPKPKDEFGNVLAR